MRLTPAIDRVLSAAMAVTFAAVGLLFLLGPDLTLRFMNRLGRGWGLAEMPLSGASFYLGLAVGYMYVVTLLAFLMFRHPHPPVFPFLLAQAKGASSVLSFGLFVIHRPALVFLANGVIDLSLCLLAFGLYRSRKKLERAAP